MPTFFRRILMNSINKRLLNDLFITKRTDCDSEIYNQLYPYIWPCENEYINFLQAKDSSVKIDCAKKIFEFYNSNYDIIFPDFFIEELIFLQQHNLKSDDRYIPQDHLVHSINLYILGVYSFFNIEVFHRKLLKPYKNENYINKHKLFIKEWSLFSLYHDIGYVIESNVNENGNISNRSSIEKYTRMNIVLLNKQIIQAIAKLITIIHIMQQAKTTFSIDEKLVCKFQWFNNSRKITTQNLIETLNRFSNHVEIQSINSDEDKLFVDWIFENTEHLIVYKDKTGNPIMFVSVDKKGKREIVYNKSMEQMYSKFISSVLFDSVIQEHSNIICTYYVADVKEKILNATPTMFHFEIFEYYQCIPQNIRDQISLLSNPNLMKQTYEIIHKWVKNEVKRYKEKAASKHLEEVSISSIKTIIDKTTKNCINDVCKQNISTQQKIEKLIAVLSKISATEVDLLIRENYNKINGISAPVCNYYDYLLNFCKKELNENIGCLKIADKTIAFNPFYYDKKSFVMKSIFENIASQSEQLNINFDELKNYKPTYTTCDHGLVSSSLLFEIIAFNEQFNKLLNKNSILSLSYHDNTISKFLDSNNSIESYSRIIFAILLHNIYVKKSVPYGIDFTHNIDINAFAYFGALMDSLQRWGRSKQLEWSILNLPKEHFLEDDYDISFINSKIVISCLSSISGNMRNYVNSLESFLPGVSNIIKVHEKEE